MKILDKLNQKLPPTKEILNRHVFLSAIFASGLIGMGGKLLMFIYQSHLGYWHYFPIFPNVLDSLYIFLASTYFLYRSLSHRSK